MAQKFPMPQDDWSDEEKWAYLLRHERLGELLVKWGKLSLAQVDELLAEQKQSTKHLGEIVVAKNLLTLDEIMVELKRQSVMDETARESIDELKRASLEHKKSVE